MTGSTVEVPQLGDRARLLDNPFYVLELAADCTRAEVERAGQKLLAMLEIDLGGARTYPTPFGSGRRDAAKIREAMAELRDPQRRLFHELWVLGRPWTSTALAGADPVDEGGFSAARSALGWRS
ncbi:hypothetical protein ENSA5_42090 [Enhygromyxa salina]|uniref:Uncharacterized protein n=1 Tax=Enhygromyxa salina TaxID=215803 RepID=A0A2S9XLU2_9BACT|nr:hypothetical protein [Enhygromyxa salina]PRP93807.1 hypothetical protein ENSA5_42090 [Enhygromyxa salina]